MSAPGGVDGKTHAMDPVRSSERPGGVDGKTHVMDPVEAMYFVSGNATPVLQLADTEHLSEFMEHLRQMQVLASIEALD